MLMLAFAAATLQPPPLVTTAPPLPPVIVTPSGRIARPANFQLLTGVERIAIRVSSPEGLLWEGSLQISPNQSASFQQSVNQAATDRCPPGSPSDRSERRHLNLSIYAQHSQQWGQTYRVDASWARPITGEACVESGTRTVQINQTVSIAPGQASVLEGDAGLRVQLSRTR